MSESKPQNETKDWKGMWKELEHDVNKYSCLGVHMATIEKKHTTVEGT
jgi:hypothetical protein